MPENSAEFLMLSPIAFFNHGQDGNGLFLRELGMDHGHITNYEPAYLDALKAQYPKAYDDAMELVEDHLDELGAWEDGYLRQLLEAPYGAIFEGYVTGSE